jgi:hypothetical protein
MARTGGADRAASGGRAVKQRNMNIPLPKPGNFSETIDIFIIK